MWRENWIIDKVPKTPMYKQDSVVDLTLSVSDLLLEGSGRWNVDLIRQNLIAEDAELILKLKPKINRRDAFKWGFTPNGCYSSQSGRKLLGILQEIQHPQSSGIPPIEKNLWKAIWKIRAPTKLAKAFYMENIVWCCSCKRATEYKRFTVRLAMWLMPFRVRIGLPSPFQMSFCERNMGEVWCPTSRGRILKIISFPQYLSSDIRKWKESQL